MKEIKDLKIYHLAIYHLPFKSHEKEGDLEIHLADFGGYHQRHPDEPGSIELLELISG